MREISHQSIESWFTDYKVTKTKRPLEGVYPITDKNTITHPHQGHDAIWIIIFFLSHFSIHPHSSHMAAKLYCFSVSHSHFSHSTSAFSSYFLEALWAQYLDILAGKWAINGQLYTPWLFNTDRGKKFTSVNSYEKKKEIRI